YFIGLPVKQPVFSRKFEKVEVEDRFAYLSDEDNSDDNKEDEDWSPSKELVKLKQHSAKEPPFSSKKRKGKKQQKDQNASAESTKKVSKKDPIRNRERNEIIENKPIPDAPKPSSTSRYPKREGARKSYKEQQVPDEDHFLYCEQCEDFYFGDCPVHGPLFPLADKDCPGSSTENRSLASLPDGLEVRESNIPGAGLGVFAKREFNSGTRFGPYEGKKVRPDIPKDDMDTSYMWEIMKEGRVVYYVNGKDEKYGNWLRYINCSRTESEQNLVAFQYHGQIYYRAYKEMKIGDELLVWYGDEYARDLGIVAADMNVGKNDSSVMENPRQKKDIGPIFSCRYCYVSYSEDRYLQRHLKFCRKIPIEHYMPKENLIQSKLKIKKVPSQSSPGVNIKKKNLVKSEIADTGDKPYRCDISGKGFSRTGALQKHLRTHTGDKPYKCDICGKAFNQSSNLQNHLRTHTGDKPYKCDICGKAFNQSQNLQTHLRTHTGDKPYKCDICGKRFSLLQNLQTHLRTHTGDKPYKCDICGKGFSVSGSLQKHLRTHTGDKPYKCDICRKGFSQSGDLQKHLRTHTGDKPYRCVICGAAYCSSSALNNHKKKCK
uniref:Uncharacterized protein n=2 Tax=Clytia hemisphaerica TaxID=252671 RepID=A0A7M5WT21_9CNID